MQYQDYYKILGVSRDASTDEIQRAYRKLARKYHPDVNKDAEAETRFKEINEAKEVLKDPEKRRLYDLYGKDWAQGGAQPPPGWKGDARTRPGREGHSRTFHFGSADEFHNPNDFSDFFNSLFGDRFARGAAGSGFETSHDAPGASHEAEIAVQLSEVFHGVTKTISFQTYEADNHGLMRPELRTLQVKIPRGVTHGSVIRLAGQGAKGAGRGLAGDLLLRVMIAPDPSFRVAGYDLHTTVPLSPWEAALGAKVTVRTVDGRVSLTIPAGTQNGARFRLNGKGIPKKSSGAGDIIVATEIRVPERLNAEEKRLFQELSRTSSFNPRNRESQRAKNEEI